jgi:hypothetical protein
MEVYLRRQRRRARKERDSRTPLLYLQEDQQALDCSKLHLLRAWDLLILQEEEADSHNLQRHRRNEQETSLLREVPRLLLQLLSLHLLRQEQHPRLPSLPQVLVALERQQPHHHRRQCRLQHLYHRLNQRDLRLRRHRMHQQPPVADVLCLGSHREDSRPRWAVPACVHGDLHLHRTRRRQEHQLGQWKKPGSMIRRYLRHPLPHLAEVRRLRVDEAEVEDAVVVEEEV